MSTISQSQNDPSDTLSSEEERDQIRSERLAFPPVYVLVGAYRLATDKNLYVPTWQKCKHGAVRGLVVGLGWAAISFHIQRKFVEIFLRNSPRVTGLSNDKLFGYQLPFTITTYATLLFITDQITVILRFFLSKNLRIARDRAWDHTVRSRGKGPDFWGPYVEEFAIPARPQSGGRWENWAASYVGRLFIRRVLLLPLNFYPFIGVGVGAYLKGVGTARYLHNRYFEAKKMTQDQIAIFMEERKWHYRAFGTVAALLEGFPIIGLVFSISNRIGAAMWAHDLEKRQHEFVSGHFKPVMPAPTGDTELRPMIGGWQDADTKSVE